MQVSVASSVTDGVDITSDTEYVKSVGVWTVEETDPMTENSNYPIRHRLTQDMSSVYVTNVRRYLIVSDGFHNNKNYVTTVGVYVIFMLYTVNFTSCRRFLV